MVPSKPKYAIPKALNVTVDVPFGFARVQRQFLTCFRCGGSHHYKSECGHFRTKICSAWERGQCNEIFCSFAHGESELRTPWVPICIRIVKVDGRIRRMGCGETGHTYRTCPRQNKTCNVTALANKLPSELYRCNAQFCCQLSSST